jgi:hypothetical protein
MKTRMVVTPLAREAIQARQGAADLLSSLRQVRKEFSGATRYRGYR